MRDIDMYVHLLDPVNNNCFHVPRLSAIRVWSPELYNKDHILFPKCQASVADKYIIKTKILSVQHKQENINTERQTDLSLRWGWKK